ncbi:hypothetical protein [Sphingobacterium arenae]|uniref:Lipoprotein n=1 Tax=Sphingobacterium arenae TaxID=1280598 RepID=A0ABR7Y1L3_9SPHI|nr:hypothetical protein [Sphingobacterium arenae]MBD1425195.1 hypothetical protein [Sphingobacterium arenae]
MYKNILDSFKIYQRYLSGVALLFFVLLSSCPVKASIKNFADNPIKKEQSSTNRSNALFHSSDRCADTELTTKVIKQGSSQHVDILPAILFTAIVFFLFCIPHRKEKAHPLYGNLKLAGTLPIFLQYRKLII